MDTVKSSNVMQEALDITGEITKLVNFHQEEAPYFNA